MYQQLSKIKYVMFFMIDNLYTIPFINNVIVIIIISLYYLHFTISSHDYFIRKSLTYWWTVCNDLFVAKFCIKIVAQIAIIGILRHGEDTILLCTTTSKKIDLKKIKCKFLWSSSNKCSRIV